MAGGLTFKTPDVLLTFTDECRAIRFGLQNTFQIELYDRAGLIVANGFHRIDRS
jgi:hypothetical protein